MTKQSLIFDLDDTLIHCNKYFEKAMHQFANLIMHWFQPHHVHYQDVRELQNQIDLRAVKESGFVRDHFPQSFIKTYHHYSRKFARLPNRQEIMTLWELGNSVYSEDFEAYPHMIETLNELSNQGHELHLYTGGEHEIQYRKIEKMGLSSFFDDRIYVTRKKVTTFLENVLSENAFERNHTWMIGNSLRTDILPAFETGIHAIFIPAEVEWEFNMIEIEMTPPRSFLQLKSLKDVPSAIAAYLSAEHSP